MVCAGKTGGTDTSNPSADFVNRNAQHASTALQSEVTVDKSFYTYFPSIKNLHNAEGIRRGNFKDLEQLYYLAEEVQYLYKY